MSIVIFGDLFSFPDGLAATNRIYTYAKGFKERGFNVHVICLSNNYMDVPDGITDGISYYNPFGQKKRNKYFIIRRWLKFKKYIKTFYLVNKINKSDRIFVINRWSETLIIQVFAWMLAKVSGTRVISECSEHPLRMYKNSFFRPIGVMKFYIDSFLCNGIICISRYLIEFHREMRIKEYKLLLVPSTVDPSRFIPTSNRPISDFYIGYFGSLTFKRDNIDALIKAFSLLSPGHPQVHLVLGGFCTVDEKQEITDLIASLNIVNKVKIIDFLTRQEITKYILNADILVMMRSKNLDSDASFPSKLTEFLATGKPVVSVSVGEISDFLTDGINSFIVAPGNVEELTKKLDFVINNYDHAKSISNKGKELTEGVFNYRFQASRIIDFINSLYKRA